MIIIFYIGRVFANNLADFFIWDMELLYFRTSGSLFHILTASPIQELRDKFDLPISISLPVVIALVEVVSFLGAWLTTFRGYLSTCSAFQYSDSDEVQNLNLVLISTF